MAANIAASEPAAQIIELPWQRGYYVASDTACADASNATLLLARREGIGGARDFCEFQTIEQQQVDLYRVTEVCRDLQGGDRQEQMVTYALRDATAFVVRDEWGNEGSYRHCPQAALPADWRDTDISDITD